MGEAGDAKRARAEVLEAAGGRPVDLDRFHGGDEVVGRQVDLLGDALLVGELEDLWASGAFAPLGPEADDRERARRLLLLTAILRVSPERQPARVVEPDDVEAALLRVVAAFRTEGDGWPTELQLVALRSDGWLRRLGATRRRWRNACALLGIDLAEALDEGGRRRWWWPHEVPKCPISERFGRPPAAKPVVYLDDYDGPRDVLGLGDDWEPGQALVVGAGLVVDAWPRTPGLQERPRSAEAAQVGVDDVDGGVVAEVVPLFPGAAAPGPEPEPEAGLEHLGAFNEWASGSQWAGSEGYRAWARGENPEAEGSAARRVER